VDTKKETRESEEEKSMKRNLITMFALAATVLAGAAAAATAPASSGADIASKVAKEIRMYSRYTIWDNVNLRVAGGEVELSGAVSRPFKKQDIQRIVQSVPGVTSVTNNLEVLPLSNFDDNLRLRVARAVYGAPALSRYAIQAVPPIHIIVKNGEVTLEGVVNNEMERNIAYAQASAAGLSFGPVKNNLRVENPGKEKS
jgi:hyperosmotically inducible protein